MEPRSPTDGQSAPELARQLELEREGVAFVVLRDAEGTQHQLVLREETMLIGRDRAAAISLAWDPEVSAVHAELRLLGERWFVVDDGLSRNGTFVNSERVSARARLADRDLIRCGRTLLMFRSPAAAAVRERERTAVATESDAVHVTAAQHRVLVALCRPFASGEEFAAPATNAAVAAELVLSVDAVKSHLRALFEAFGLGGVPQNEKRLRLAERALRTGVVRPRELLETPPMRRPGRG